ncbi:30S ribosomal protein S8e [Candidatus Woesearchaeota archaeon]|nr:30S ribosomal protein S8e [Candidatus Woesearchaeota archaeon]
MVVSQHRSRRKGTGGRYRSPLSKKLSNLGRLPTLTKIGEHKNKPLRVRGGLEKVRVLVAGFANIVNPKDKTFKKVKIKTVTENAANRHYVRRNIITKGAVIDTELGKARVTSRPGQDGTVNAVLI